MPVAVPKSEPEPPAAKPDVMDLEAEPETLPRGIKRDRSPDPVSYASSTIVSFLRPHSRSETVRLPFVKNSLGQQTSDVTLIKIAKAIAVVIVIALVTENVIETIVAVTGRDPAVATAVGVGQDRLALVVTMVAAMIVVMIAEITMMMVIVVVGALTARGVTLNSTATP